MRFTSLNLLFHPAAAVTAVAFAMLPGLLLTACAPLTVARMPNESVIRWTDGKLTAPDCRAMQQRSEMPMQDGPLQVTERPSVAFGCATYGNLSKMIDNPQDLVDPAPYPGQSSTTAGAAVQRYYDDKVKALESSATSGVKSGSGGGAAQ